MLLPYGEPSPCYLCGHATWGQSGSRGRGGTGTLDHVIPRTERPDLATAVTNLRPVHDQACPTCGLRCNSIKAGYSETRARRVIAAKLAKMGLDVPAEQDDTEPEGRDWDGFEL
jgi:hypothetical protein